MRRPQKQTCTQQRLELQEHELKVEQSDEEEATMKGRLNPVQELSGRQIDRVKKLPREAERISIHSLGG